MIRSKVRASLLALALVSMGSTAFAVPLLGDRALTPDTQRSLAAEIRVERAAHPDRFVAVTSLYGLRPEVYRVTRARVPSVTRELVHMGPDALLPMLDVLAFSGYPHALSTEERQTLEVGILEAVGALRDRRAAPVLRSAFERMTSPDATRAAARALGALAGDGEVSLLSTSARAQGPRQLAALEGLGMARRDDATQTIIDVLDHASDEAVVIASAKGLAAAGSTWALAAAHRTSTLPERCAEALVRALVRTSGAARDEVQLAIVAVAAPETPALLQRARATADVDTQHRIDTVLRMVNRQLGR